MEQAHNSYPQASDLIAIEGDDLYGYYVRDIEQYPPLTSDEENELYSQIEMAQQAVDIFQDQSFQGTEEQYMELQEALRIGDEARDMLILSNTRFVISIAKKWRLTDFLDAIQLGNIGLIQAVDNIDTARDNRLITYAKHRIMRSINRGLLPEKYSIRLPERVLEGIKQINDYLQDTSQQYETLSVETIAQAIHLEPNRVKEYMTLYDLVHSSYELDNRGENGQGEKEIPHEVVPAAAPSVEQIVEKRLLSYKMRSLIDAPDVLTDRQRVVIGLIFGLNDNGSMTYDEVGNELGISRQAVGNIFKFAKERLVKAAEAEHLEEFLQPKKKTVPKL